MVQLSFAIQDSIRVDNLLDLPFDSGSQYYSILFLPWKEILIDRVTNLFYATRAELKLIPYTPERRVGVKDIRSPPEGVSTTTREGSCPHYPLSVQISDIPSCAPEPEP